MDHIGSIEIMMRLLRKHLYCYCMYGIIKLIKEKAKVLVMNSVAIASIKREMNGKRVKFLGSYVLPEVPTDIDEKLKGSYDVPSSVISFNTVDMLRTADNGEVSHCSLKGTKAYMGDNGFLMTTEWNDGINVMIYQFA